TGIAKLPPGSSVDVGDKYAEKSSVLPKILVMLFLVWWVHSYLDYQGWFYTWTDGKYGKPTPEIRERMEREKQERDKREAAEKKAAEEAASKAKAEAAAAAQTNAAAAK